MCLGNGLEPVCVAGWGNSPGCCARVAWSIDAASMSSLSSCLDFPRCLRQCEKTPQNSVMSPSKQVFRAHGWLELGLLIHYFGVQPRLESRPLHFCTIAPLAFVLRSVFLRSGFRFGGVTEEGQRRGQTNASYYRSLSTSIPDFSDWMLCRWPRPVHTTCHDNRTQETRVRFNK